MAKIVTSITGWNDSLGKRMSITYSEIDESTGKITSDNKRTDVVVTDANAKSGIDTLISFAQSIIDSQEG
jgi:hypothetical protein